MSDQINIARDTGHWPSDVVEVIAKAVYTKDPIYKPPYWEDCTPDMKVWYRSMACHVLNALSNHRVEAADV